MSTKWAYINNRGTGSIARIYCIENPSDINPSGEWIVIRRIGPNNYLRNLSENSFFYYSEVQNS
jgi:hypothetical protein